MEEKSAKRTWRRRIRESFGIPLAGKTAQERKFE